MGRKKPTYSVIIPALNEEERIEAAVRSAVEGGSSEVIVVDGGSRDNTVGVAKNAGATKVYTSARAARSVQMNIGARKSRGNILVFLHADSILPPQYGNMIDSSLGSMSKWGCFHSIDIRNHDIHPLLAFVMKHSVALRTRLFSKPYGDQAIFVTRKSFHEVGGYRDDWKLLEDVDLVEKLKHTCGSPVIIPHALKTSGRRWCSLGAVRTTLINQYILFRYAMGANVNELEKVYRKNS